jgi:Mg-chelatase subunit ChlD
MTGLFAFLLFFSFLLASSAGGAEPKIQILSPKDGARILQEQNSVLINGKVSSQGEQRANVDLFLIVDTSGSTAHYAGMEINDPEFNIPSASPWGRPPIGIFGGGIGVGAPPPRDLRNSVLVAEIAASRRLLSQLNPQTTRVGVITFAEGAAVVQALTHDFERVKQSLDQVLSAGPHGGTNMAEGIRQAIRELSGLGLSQRRDDAVKAGLLLTDGVPTLPIGASKRAAPEDTQLAINAARIAGKGGIKIHVFALGQEAVSYPRAAVGIARESGGVFTPVNRPADVLGVLETISVVGVDYVQVINETLGQKASQFRLAVDGFFSAALPVTEGLNRIQVLARTGDGSLARESITVHYQRTNQRSLDLEVFLEREKSLELQVERLGKTRQEIEQEVNRDREQNIRRPQQALPPPTDGPSR